MRQRLDREATKSQAGMLWAATYVLMGLAYPDELIERLVEGVQGMKESVTYQKILREGRVEGRVEEARRILRRQGTRRFGTPDAPIDDALDAIADLERLEQLSDRILDVKTWDELLAQP
jgi:predicted transposase YdaD